MKKGILLLLLVSSVFANAQSLKDALYGGKLKNEPGTVIRKGDDLTTKMDTVRKTSATDTAITKTPVLTMDSLTNKALAQSNAAVTSTNGNNSGLTDTAATGTASASKENTTAAKDNNAVWKDYMTAVTTTLQAEVLPSKKIKKGSYYVSVSYAIGTDGQVAINNVLLTPENTFLQQQIKDRLAVDVPRLTPVLSASGAPRRVSKNHNFTLVKD